VAPRQIGLEVHVLFFVITNGRCLPQVEKQQIGFRTKRKTHRKNNWQYSKQRLRFNVFEYRLAVLVRASNGLLVANPKGL
jgi:hypothetical protein